VALLNCRDLGRRVWVERRGEVVGPLLVVDCAGRRHAAALRARGWVVDLPWELGRLRWRLIGPRASRQVTVHFVDPGRLHTGAAPGRR
jgi:hypothetical protein